MIKKVNISDIQNYGFLQIEISKTIDLKKEISELKKSKSTVILAHYYQNPEIQDIADIVGDSLELARKAEETSAEIILLSGVKFMAETAKILNPDKKVLLPDMNAGCSLSDSCSPVLFKNFIDKYPDHTVISYINTSAEIKAMSDIICTSSNAVKIIESIPLKEKIIFAPDKNLGNYIKSVTGREMIIWNGSCHVHEEFSLEKILEIKEKYRDCKIIAHPECDRQILLVSDHVGSTVSLLNFTRRDEAHVYIVATESGIIHQMKKYNPEKTFIPAPPKDSTCGCNDCNFMKLNNLEKIYLCLKYEIPEIILDEKILYEAKKSINRMLELSK